MFIARISRGRTVREFVVGVLLVPTAFTFLWMTVFGDTAIHAVLTEGATELLVLVDENVPLALFGLLERLPWSTLTSVVATLLVVTFFVTSSDSGSLVIDMITSGGADDPPVWQRVFWALTQGVVAAVLLLAGGLGALQTAAIASGLPFAAVMLLICVGLITALGRERAESVRLQAPPHPVVRERLDWRKRLAHLARHHDRGAAARFLAGVARPALEKVALELRSHDQDVHMDQDDDRSVLQVIEDDHVVFEYGVQLRSYRTVTFAFVETPKEQERSRHWFVEAWCTSTGERYDVLGLGEEALIEDLLNHYSRWVNARNETLGLPGRPD
jgi:choline/glycine/proline betaine transport protein